MPALARGVIPAFGPAPGLPKGLVNSKAPGKPTKPAKPSKPISLAGVKGSTSAPGRAPKALPTKPVHVGPAFGPAPGLPKGLVKPSKAPNTSRGVSGTAQIPTHGGRGVIGDVGHFLGTLATSAEQAAAGGKVATKAQEKQAKEGKLHGAVIQSPDITVAGGNGVYGNLLKHYSDVGAAFANNPLGTAQHTAESVGPFANALVTGLGRMAVGTVQGHGQREAEAFWHGLEQQAHQELSHGASDVERIEKEGALNELANATLAVGGAGRLLAAAGRIAIPADRFEAAAAGLRAVNEARRAEALRKAAGEHGPMPRPPATLTKGQTAAATIHEVLHGERPNLRTAPGTTEPSRTPGSGLRPQERSRNLIVAAGQTKLDKARLERQIGSLHRVAEARVRAALNPHLPGYELGDTYAHQLAHDTMRGEVMPLLSRGTDRIAKLTGGPRGATERFLGADRSQRIGVSRTVGGERIVQQRALHVLEREARKGMRKLSTPQKMLLTLAKEGKLNLDDPAKGLEKLQQIHDLAKKGNVNVTMGIQDIKNGADLAREAGHVLDYIKKHGAESVFTPAFRTAVHTIPDERALSDLNPILARVADHKVARKYLPQVAFLHDLAEANPGHPDSAATIAGARQIHTLLSQGHGLRAAAQGVRSADLSHTAEARAAEAARVAQKGGEAVERSIRKGPVTSASIRRLKAAEAHTQELKAEAVRARKALKALKKNPVELHNRADEAFGGAKNLADELARMHGLPTDRAYIPHVQSLSETKGKGVQTYSPADYKKWEGILQKSGRISTDPQLIFRGIERTARDISSQRVVNDVQRKFAVRLPRKNMTVKQLQTWMNNTGRNPEDWRIVHFGQLRHDIEGMANADNLRHLNTNESTHLATLQDALTRASTGLRSNDKGAQLIPKAAYDELAAFYHQSPALARVGGRAKGQVSKLMLGLSLPWAIGMYPAYAVQSLAGRAGPVDFLSNLRWYRSLNEGDKMRFDHPMGIDSPYTPGSHGIDKEKVGVPTTLQGLGANMRVMRESPLGRALSGVRPLDRLGLDRHALNPVDQLLGFERHARRGSRINVAVKGVKNEAIRQMVSDMSGAQKSMNSFEVRLKKLQMAGRMPAKEYMNKALANTAEMEKVAQHVERVMGNFHHMTAFEKNIVNRSIMFYPWVRYSLKLLAHTLPTRHPALFAIGLKLGQMEHHELHELLGTEPELGQIYLGAAQPGLKPEDRQFQDINLKDINPVLNSAVTALSPGTGGNVGQLMDLLPPYMASAIGYAAGKNLFTDKPLTGSTEATAFGFKPGKRPALVPYAAHEAEQYFFPSRVLGHQLGGPRPQSSEGAPAFGLSAPKEYSRKTERKIGKEPHAHPLLNELFPFVPGAATRLPQLAEKEKKEAKVEKKQTRKQARRERLESQGSWAIEGGTGQ